MFRLYVSAIILRYICFVQADDKVPITERFSNTNRFMGVYVRKPGRFETLGWAKSFYTHGLAIYRLNWARGNYDSTVWMKNYTPSNLYKVV